ncbi:hypothetical protein [Cylindrospermopsis raciborskii]|uniref:hypothetical protein n=1 Tax=Cylindrospermopsis raciborskii TaxID=77022 RepID=UPI00077898D3|nr:hypothetical protein [Cylindrospermopsis raciborskii]
MNSNRLVGILWSHPVFNPQKSSGTVMGHRVNGDRFLVKGENISSVRNTIALMSQSTYMKMSNKEKLCL